ncbi:NAD(P)/FAD-dependent oxidoreductase [Methylocella sp.]|uniref:NAD(P)/FAD-dependent oxidoreductase n=1 Tax=Methylocella sp. TaxID=1978226 RepID=UPI0037851349
MAVDESENAAGRGCVIVGAGQAGAEAAILLRQQKYGGRIILLGEESSPPYLRPPLSKAYLSGEIGAEALIFKASTAYEKADVELRLSTRVDRIDRPAKRVVLQSGETLAYDTLILATGGRARRLAAPGAGLDGVFSLRAIADVERLKPELAAGRRLVIVGGGYVGLEIAAVAVKKGLRTLVLEAAPRALARVTAPEVSRFYEAFHRKAGVEIRTGVGVSGFAEGATPGRVGFVLTGDGGRVEADVVLVGVGLVPNDELAAAAGLEVDRGVLVDGSCRTSDPDIFAIGDCAVHRRHGFLERAVRLESVPNALETARIAASVIAGRPAPAATAPWFWSDQYDLKLQMAGLSEGYDELVVRGSMEDASFTAFYLKDGRVIAADAVNRPGDFMAAKRLIAERVRAKAADLADEAVSLKSLLAASGG